jgi:signal transduction histidine kinase
VLHEFVTTHRDEILARMREKVAGRGAPSGASASDPEGGVSAFLTQLSSTLRWEATATPFSATAIGATATRHGRDLLARGFNVSQVVHDYGDICQAITELALERDAPIGIEEFHILNRCLDTAIAEAVTEHARITADRVGTEENERLGQVAHELRNSLNTAILAFQSLKLGTVAINGSTGMVLGRSLVELRDLIDAALSEVRLQAGAERRERLAVGEFLDEIAVVAHLHAECRGIQFSVAPVPRQWAVSADPQLLTSAVMNLLNNAFKFTRRGGRVELRAAVEGGRVLLEVADECGGIPHTMRDPFEAFAERRGRDRTGLGLGLSIARKAVIAQDGTIRIRNMPGTGCVFVIDLPLAQEVPSAGPTAG